MTLTTNGWPTLFEAAGATSEMTEAEYAEMIVVPNVAEPIMIKSRLHEEDTRGEIEMAHWHAMLAKDFEGLLPLQPLGPDFLAVTREIARGE
jgi:hypothetical protein